VQVVFGETGGLALYMPSRSCSTSTWPSQCGAGANADHGNADGFRDALHRGRYAFQQQQRGAGLFQKLARLRSPCFAAASAERPLHLVATEDIDGLRGEPHVHTGGNAAARHLRDGLGQPAAAFQFHGVRTGLHQFTGVLQRIFVTVA
jgi:hypothetical protein